MKLHLAAGLALLVVLMGLPARAQTTAGALEEARKAVRGYHERQAAQGDAAAALWLAEHTEGVAALDWYRKAAERGSPEARGELAWRYDHGEGAPRDDAEALKWARLGAEDGDETALEALAERYRDGRGLPADLAKALECYDRIEPDPDEAAIPALREVGRRDGKPVSPTFNVLLDALRERSAGSDARANWALYAFSKEGFGLRTADPTLPLAYLRRAAELRDPQAETELGEWYASGGPGYDPGAALAWFREAALAGYSPAIGSLVNSYEQGGLAEPDAGKALEWLRRGAMAEDPDAMVALAERLGTGTYPGGPEGVYDQDPDEAMILLHKAARKGHAQAMYLLGLYNLDGMPFARSPATAAGWLRKAADLGHVGAMGALAGLHEAGRGVPADQAKAFELYERAGMLIRQGRAYRDGRGVDRNPYLALDCFLAEIDRVRPAPSEALVWLGRMFEEGRGVPRDAGLGLALYAESRTPAGALLQARYEDTLPGATLQGRLAAYQALAGDLAGMGGLVPADPAAALAWFRKAAADYLERFEEGSL